MIIRLAVLVSFLASGCTVRAPAAAHLASGEVATVSFSRSDPSIEVTSAVLDSQSISTNFNTIELAPGPHDLAMTYRVRVSDMCDDLRAECPSTTVTGRCQGTFTLAAGQQVVVGLSARRGEMEARVRPPLTFGNWFADAAPDIARLQCERHSSVEGTRRGAL
ncbi:MAG: hypothetical protein RL326_1977 [Pseudomonadota bacterium]|jgi:hypothetical protein